MHSKKIQDIMDKFVAAIVKAAEEEALDKIRAFAEVNAAPAVVRRKSTRKSTKGQSTLRPCPIEGCKNTAAPRFHMVCKKHDDELSRDEIVLARDVAKRPGGIWHKHKEKQLQEKQKQTG